MELQGNGGRAVGVSPGGSKRGRWDRPRPDGLCWGRLAWLLCWILLACGIGHAQSTRYVYDANGRVVAVTANNATSVQYGYDTLGQAGRISVPSSSGQPAIFAFVPTHGVTGTQVTLEGQGFSASAANDSVSFNGTTATVLSASTNQLTVDVPNGATTGPISVTVAGQTATSASPFLVDDTGLPPTIAQVTPAVVAAGGTVTVAGAHFDPVAGDTTLQMGGVNLWTMSSLSDTQLQYTVPSNARSGHVTVSTPYGEATSALPVSVLPSSVVSKANGAAVTYLTANGNPSSFSTATAGSLGILTFDASQNSNLELMLNGIAITGSSATEVTVNVYGPTGAIVASYNCYTTNPAASCREALWNLPAGTYTAVVSPVDTGSLIQFNALLTPDTIGAALVANTPTAVHIGSGQVERFTFTAKAGDTVALNLAGVSTTPGGQSMGVNIYYPNLTTIAPTNYTTELETTTSETFNLSNLPVSGTYTVVVYTIYGEPGSAQLTLASGATGAVTTNGAAQSYAADVPGQNIYLSFTANAGDNDELGFANIQGSFQVNVYNSSNTNIASFGCSSSNPHASCRYAIWNLAAGNYSVVLSPNSSGAISAQALLQTDVIGSALTYNSPVTASLAEGQVERFTFTANAGDTVALNLAGVSTTPGGQGMGVNIYYPNLTTIVPTNYTTESETTNSEVFNLPNLPVSGTYTVVVYTDYGEPGSAQLTLGSGITGTITTNGAAQSYAANVPGQNMYLSFTAAAADNDELTFANLQGNFQVNVYNSSNTNIASFNCSSSNPGAICRYPIWNLAAGNYSVVLSPGSSGKISVQAMLQTDVIGAALAYNTPVTVNLGAGQVERFTFTANAGASVAVKLTGVTTTPGGLGMGANVYYPNLTTIGLTNYAANAETVSFQTMNLTNLPVSGTYTVVVYTDYGEPGNAQLSVVPQ